MPEINVTAIVLRRRDSGENDRRLTLLTREFGKLDAVAKGARKSASRLAGSSDPLVTAHMTLATGKVNRFITQSQPKSSFRGLRQDYERLTLALALAELYAAVLPWEQPDEESYDLLALTLGFVEKHSKPLVVAAWGQLRLLALSGFMSQFDRCAHTGVEVQETPAWFSATGGGYLVPDEAIQFSDRVQVRAEVLYGLAKTVQLEEPPPNLKFVEEALILLGSVWKHVADTDLPANKAVLDELRHR
jgi:DNA repair protein RecO